MIFSLRMRTQYKYSYPIFSTLFAVVYVPLRALRLTKRQRDGNVLSTELYLIYLEVALLNKHRSQKNMADLYAVGGRLAAEVNGLSQ